MINNIQLLRNIGQFESVSAGAHIALARLTLLYAENGRGKTTLGAILRSLATGDPLPIAERRRLSAQHPPHVVVACDGGPPEAMFDNNAWNRTIPNLVVFDDIFVDQNIHSGLAVEPGHRQNLHELILGAQAVSLNRQLQQFIAQIERHNSDLREKASAIPVTVRGTYSVDDFCALPPRPDVDTAIGAAERILNAAREQEPVRNTPPFDLLSLPAFDVAAIDRLLAEDLPALDAAAAAQVQAHLAELGAGGERWISEGIRFIPPATAEATTRPCPFCAQDLTASTIFSHYRAYFSDAYDELKRTISTAIEENNRTHGDDRPVAFERAVRIAGERRQFWSRFGEMPEITIDTAAIARDWRIARGSVASAMARKQATPLEHMTMGADTRAAITNYDAHRAAIAILNDALAQANSAILLIKNQAATGNPASTETELTRLKAVRARHTPEISALCDEYFAERAAKTATEQQRDGTRAALDNHRTTAFGGYQSAVNQYLHRFNAGFSLDGVTSTNTRGGPTCNYNVLINNTPVPVGGEPLPGQPSFRNTLSSGDRNTLALAFFFASLERDPDLNNKIIVIDDPVSSLDDHRCLTTIQEIRRLVGRASQVIVLSHNKGFLCRIWEGTGPTIRAALQVARDGTGSTLQPWDVDQECVTEHDRRHAILREYLASGTTNDREVAKAIRPLLEAFLRVACPACFPPGTLLGNFLNICRQRLNTPQQVLDEQATQELEDLADYANRFHHDTNPAWMTVQINDGELRGFVQRALDFAKP
jgi:wobble nucleotide-excising tRNase